MYSLISIRIMLRSSSKRASARVLASSVLPTPVGPRKIKEPIGRSGALIPALARKIASLTTLTASSWPITRSWSTSSKWSSFSLSPVSILVTGMPVQRLTTLAISSSPTSSFKSWLSAPLAAMDSSSACSFFCSSGRRPYFSSDSLFRS